MAYIREEEKQKQITVTGEQIEEIVGKKAEIEKNTADIAKLKENGGSADLTELKKQVETNTSWITAHAQTAAVFDADIAQNKADIANRYTKEETDNAITAKVSEIVAGAPEDFDTLKEMSDWFTNHTNSAATMNTAIQANTNAITATQADIEKKNEAIEQNRTDISLLTDNALMKNQGAENVGKILVVGTDGNLILTDIPEGSVSGDVTGVLDEANNILLSGNLADGTYTLKYENADGTFTEIGTLEVGTIEEPKPEPTNLFVIGGDGYLADGRCSSAGADRTDTNGDCMVTNYIDITNGDTVYIKNFNITSANNMYSGMKYSDGTTQGFFPSSSDLVTNYSSSNGITQFTINSENADYIRISGLPTLTVNDIVVTVNEPLS